MLEHNNAVGVGDGVQAVRNNDLGAALQKGIEALAHSPFGIGVGGGGCLIQHYNIRVTQQCPGDGDALALATR